MPVIHNFNDLSLHPLFDYVLISLYDKRNNKISTLTGDFPFIFAINKSGDTSISRYISDVKSRYGRTRFGIPNSEIVVLYYKEERDGKYYFKSEDSEVFIFEPHRLNIKDEGNPITNYLPQNDPNLNSRYKGNAIGNSQNLFIRNILSNLGNESFSGADWEDTKNYFDNICVYCGQENNLIMEHAIPINKTKLGEHKIGNLVPSCRECNSRKHFQSYEEFLAGSPDKIKQIEDYMALKNYVPLESNENYEAIVEILELAHSEVGALAKRYISIINKFSTSNEN